MCSASDSTDSNSEVSNAYQKFSLCFRLKRPRRNFRFPSPDFSPRSPSPELKRRRENDEIGAGEIAQLSFLYRNGSITNAAQMMPLDQDVMVMPLDYADLSLIKTLYKKGLCVGKDGSILTEGDFVYDVRERKTYVLDYCSGFHYLRFHEGCLHANEISIAPVFLTYCEDFVFSYDLILLKSECFYPSYQTRVGPVAKLLGRALLKFRLRKRRMQVMAEVARKVLIQSDDLAQIMGPFID